MSVTWIDAPGSTLASRSEAVDFAVSGPPGSPGITQVTWIDTPSSTLPSRFEPIDFIVGGGSPVEPAGDLRYWVGTLHVSSLPAGYYRTASTTVVSTPGWRGVPEDSYKNSHIFLLTRDLVHPGGPATLSVISRDGTAADDTTSIHATDPRDYDNDTRFNYIGRWGSEAPRDLVDPWNSYAPEGGDDQDGFTYDLVDVVATYPPNDAMPFPSNLYPDGFVPAGVEWAGATTFRMAWYPPTSRMVPADTADTPWDPFDLTQWETDAPGVSFTNLRASDVGATFDIDGAFWSSEVVAFPAKRCWLVDIVGTVPPGGMTVYIPSLTWSDKGIYRYDPRVEPRTLPAPSGGA